MKTTSVSLNTNKNMHLSTAVMGFVRGTSSQDNGGQQGTMEDDEGSRESTASRLTRPRPSEGVLYGLKNNTH